MVITVTDKAKPRAREETKEDRPLFPNGTLFPDNNPSKPPARVEKGKSPEPRGNSHSEDFQKKSHQRPYQEPPESQHINPPQKPMNELSSIPTPHTTPTPPLPEIDKEIETDFSTPEETVVEMGESRKEAELKREAELRKEAELKKEEEVKKGEESKETEPDMKSENSEQIDHPIELEVEPHKDFPQPVVNENSLTVLNRRYLKKDEDGNVIEEPIGMFFRVARNIAEVERIHDPDADVEGLTRSFYEFMASLDFLPNSPTMMNAGRELQQLSACFVLPVEDSMPSIFETVKNTALIHQSGGGTGFSFSKLRPKNDRVRSTKGVSSGPISFMTVFDAATETIKQGGTRRGANMGVLRIDHPDIEDFIRCKSDTEKLNNFNISVALTDEFMDALNDDKDFNLKNPRTGEVVGTKKAREVFDNIVEMAWKSGEPGIIFIDRINRDNPTPHVGEIESTNPCGEQPLLPYESCNLGSINLANMVKGGWLEGTNGNSEPATIDYEKLKGVVYKSTHFLDNVIDANHYPLKEIEKNTKENRKIGLGVMGFAEMLIKLDTPYNSEEAIKTAEEVISFIQTHSKDASIKLALERGSFPNFYGSTWEKNGYPMMRNATTTTIAPTGTISIIALTSSGIEPLFALSFVRNVMDDDELLEVNSLFEERAKKDGFYSVELMKKIAEEGGIRNMDEVPENVKKIFVTAHDISPEWHIRMQAAFQKYTDNAVSKTVNFSQDATKEDVRKVFELAYNLSCKGVTVYRDRSRDAQVLNIGEVNREGQTTEDFQDNGTSMSPRSRADVTWGTTRKMKTGCGDLYVTINEDREGLFEIFAQMGKAGGCSASQNETTGRLISLALRSGVDVNTIIKQLSGIRCPSPLWDTGVQILSCSDAIARAIKLYLEDYEHPKMEMTGSYTKPEIRGNGDPSLHDKKALIDPAEPKNMIATCPDCGSTLFHESGCLTCTICGFSKC